MFNEDCELREGGYKTHEFRPVLNSYKTRECPARSELQHILPFVQRRMGIEVCRE